MKHVEELRIKQVHDDCHYETSIEERMRSGFMPIVIGYGCTQEEADTEALKKFSLRQIDEDNKRFLGYVGEDEVIDRNLHLDWQMRCFERNVFRAELRDKVNKI